MYRTTYIAKFMQFGIFEVYMQSCNGDAVLWSSSMETPGIYYFFVKVFSAFYINLRNTLLSVCPSDV